MNFKSKDFYKNLALFLLIILLLLQASYLWLRFSIPKKSDEGDFKSHDLSVEVFMPVSLVVNLGPKEHYMLNNFKNYWRAYARDISEIMLNVRSENVVLISPEEYLSLQDQKSLVFKFSSPLSGSILINLMGEEKLDNNINISVSSIYISRENEVYIGGSNNYYRLTGLKTNLNIQRLLDSAPERGKNYLNFKEVFGINKDLLIPDSSFIESQRIYYEPSINEIDESIKNNLAIRFLGSDLDAIREIKEFDKTSYIFENKYLSFNSNSILEFSDEKLIDIGDRNLYSSIVTSLKFLSKNSGMYQKIYLDKIEPLDFQHSKGYKFYYNFKESGKNLVFNSKDGAFIEMEVFSDHVKSYREFYYKKSQDPNYMPVNIKILRIDDVVSENLPYLEGTDPMEILKNISDLNIVYMTEDLYEATSLNLAYELTYANKKFYFDISNGKLLLIRW